MFNFFCEVCQQFVLSVTKKRRLLYFDACLLFCRSNTNNFCDENWNYSCTTKCIFRLMVKSSGVSWHHIAQVDIFGNGSDNFIFEKAAAGALFSFLALSSHMSTHTHIWHTSLCINSPQFRRGQGHVLSCTVAWTHFLGGGVVLFLKGGQFCPSIQCAVPFGLG